MKLPLDILYAMLTVMANLINLQTLWENGASPTAIEGVQAALKNTAGYFIQAWSAFKDKITRYAPPVNTLTPEGYDVSPK